MCFLLFFCIFTCPVQLSMIYVERRSKNTIIIIIIVNIVIIIIILIIIIIIIIIVVVVVTWTAFRICLMDDTWSTAPNSVTWHTVDSFIISCTSSTVVVLYTQSACMCDSLWHYQEHCHDSASVVADDGASRKWTLLFFTCCVVTNQNFVVVYMLHHALKICLSCLFVTDSCSIIER